MAKYVDLGRYFSCWFYWTDAIPAFREKEETECEEYYEEEQQERLKDHFILPRQKRYIADAPEGRDHTRVHKDDYKYYGDEPHFETIKAMIRPENEGGLPRPHRECEGDVLAFPSGELFQRREAREKVLARADENGM